VSSLSVNSVFIRLL